MNKSRNILSLKQTLLQILINGIALGIAIWLVESAKLNSPIGMFTGAALISVLQVLSRSFFSLIAKIFGLFGILTMSLFGNALLVWITFSILPSLSVGNFWEGFITAWIYSVIATIIQWALLSQSDELYLSLLTRNNKNKKQVFNNAGFLYLQLDGVSFPVLDWQLKAGNLPNISRLINEKDYNAISWKTQIPSTTPASQAGILFGNNESIPAFRWYEKETDSLIVANQSTGAKIIEKRSSNDNGLLKNGGVSVGNLFSGDAKDNVMVMSKLGGDKQAIRSINNYSQYFYSSTGFIRSAILSIGEMLKEIYQAKRQEKLDMKPRIKRHGSYIALRAATNVFLRDLQTSIVIENMMKGVNGIYVDFLDYDEVAHHAGPARAESLASLSGLDRVVGLIDKARELAPRNYELILLSDHGQSQGRTFKQLHGGKTLQDFVQDYLGAQTTISSQTSPIEQNTQLSQLNKKSEYKNMKISTDVVITGSGNLGNIWFKNYKKRLKIEEIDKLYPDFINKLNTTPGIGLVIVDSKEGPICFGKNCSINLSTKKVINRNPLKDYGYDYSDSLLKLRKIKNAPDVCVISSYDAQSGEVHAFEELVGNHGGIGGWQTDAILVHPKHLRIDNKLTKDGLIVDSENLHKQLIKWQKNVK